MLLDRENAEDTKEILRLGTATPFWRIIEEAIDDSISHLQAEQDGDAMKDLPADQYKLEAELMKAKRKYLTHLKNLPNSLIQYLTEPAGNSESDKNYDPFYSEEEMKQELSKPKED